MDHQEQRDQQQSPGDKLLPMLSSLTRGLERGRPVGSMKNCLCCSTLNASWSILRGQKPITLHAVDRVDCYEKDR